MSKQYQVLIDGYRALGLEVGASTKSVRTAYRKLMRQWHPDVNRNSASSVEKAKELNDVFGRLKSLSARELKALKGFYRSSGPSPGPRKPRRQYSRPTPPPRPAPRRPSPPRSAQQRSGRYRRKGRDVIGEVDLTAEEQLFGAYWRLAIRTCETCGGWGAAIDARLTVCEGCRGLGVDVTRWPISACGHCDGRGGHYNRVCTTCGGRGNYSSYSAKFHVPPGAGRDYCGLVDGLGHRGIGGEAAGDLYILVV